jgi:hypothetical protein
MGARASGLWPTPTATDGESAARHGYMKSGHFGTTLYDAARLTGYLGEAVTNYAAPIDAARLAEWMTPTPNEDAAGNWGAQMQPMLGAQVKLISGATPSGSLALTAKRGQLNPAFSRWLMGYPAAWDVCAATAMPSCRKSGRSSSRRSSRRSAP